MAAQLLAFAVNMGISFLLAPIIEAKMENTYGFVTLANQFVLYAQIVVSALNTMASRFITIHIHKLFLKYYYVCIRNFHLCDEPSGPDIHPYHVRRYYPDCIFIWNISDL